MSAPGDVLLNAYHFQVGGQIQNDQDWMNEATNVTAEQENIKPINLSKRF